MPAVPTFRMHLGQRWAWLLALEVASACAPRSPTSARTEAAGAPPRNELDGGALNGGALDGGTADATTPDILDGVGQGDEFEGKSSTIDEPTREIMRWSWRSGCPVPLEQLRLLTFNHWGFDGHKHRGELVVHADIARAVLGVFEGFFQSRYPIDRIELVDRYEGDDHKSMRANNTSAFNCREMSGRPGVWSQHAYGLAIDLNPLQNPYVSGTKVSPVEGQRYIDRSLTDRGVIHPGDEAVRAFARIGWRWGGNWKSAQDYQHFSANGR
jgi:hypothetical protein